MLFAQLLNFPFYMNFYTLICRYLSQNDIKVIAGSGCPSTDRKVVNSGKRLRAHVGMNEGNVCIKQTFLFIEDLLCYLLCVLG